MTLAGSAYDSLTRLDGGSESRSAGAADWPRTGPNFDIRSHNSGHNRRRDFAATVLPWGKRGVPATGWHHGQRRAVIRRRDGGWLRRAGDRHRVAGSAVGAVGAGDGSEGGKARARLSKTRKQSHAQ